MMNRYLSVVVFCLLVAAAQIATAVAADTAARSPQTQQERFSDAMQSFREHRYAAAYGRFAAIADAGHWPSAQLALAMVGHGRELFGSDWSASPDQRRRWNELVIGAARQRIEPLDDERSD